MAAETDPPTATDHEQQTRRIPRWLLVLAALALAGVVVGVIVYGYWARPGWIGVSGKKFWDYLELLIVPAALAIGGYLFNRAQRERELEAEEAQQDRERRAQEDRRKREREAQAAQRERELEVENQRARDVALQAYLDQMSHLLTDKDRPLRRAQPSDNLSVVARARTLVTLTRLDGRRKRSVVQFLMESGLITKDRHIVNLSGADLSEADLHSVNLSGANLSGANLSRADLRWSELSEAELSNANLNSADLSSAALIEAHLIHTDLSKARLITTYLLGANLMGANLSKANLLAANLNSADLSSAALIEAHLISANLTGADLSAASLHETDFSSANLSGANLRDASTLPASGGVVPRVTNETLQRQAESLDGATMPDGQKYEDWLKDREKGQQDE